jgi:hypothetical protein
LLLQKYNSYSFGPLPPAFVCWTTVESKTLTFRTFIEFTFFHFTHIKYEHTYITQTYDYMFISRHSPYIDGCCYSHHHNTYNQHQSTTNRRKKKHHHSNNNKNNNSSLLLIVIPSPQVSLPYNSCRRKKKDRFHKQRVVLLLRPFPFPIIYIINICMYNRKNFRLLSFSSVQL